VLYEILGDEAFTPSRFFAGATPNRTHRALAELAHHEALAGIITTNFDSAIEQALADRAVPYRLFVLEEEFADHQETTPLPVLKLHGSISDKPQIHGQWSEKTTSWLIRPKANRFHSQELTKANALPTGEHCQLRTRCIQKF